ncbi:uncharacterized protein TNCV_1153281 [Trichonephila clavipes]|nr:uncharacterized protein TNCV_1153281 [Trichonephila clavipes]
MEEKEKVSAAPYVTVMDLSKGYFRFRSRRAQRYAAFVTPFGTYIPKKMMFGLLSINVMVLPAGQGQVPHPSIVPEVFTINQLWNDRCTWQWGHCLLSELREWSLQTCCLKGMLETGGVTGQCVQLWTRNYGALDQTSRVCFGVLCANIKRDFVDLRIRRSEGRVVNTPLLFKKGCF